MQRDRRRGAESRAWYLDSLRRPWGLLWRKKHDSEDLRDDGVVYSNFRGGSSEDGSRDEKGASGRSLLFVGIIVGLAAALALVVGLGVYFGLRQGDQNNIKSL